MKQLYQFHPQLILRTPAQPFTTAIDDAGIAAALADEAFMEAIYLASPGLHEECRRWQRGELTDARKTERLRATLTRYYARRASRSTPFGLFAGCARIGWGPSSRVRLAPTAAGRHTRLDMHYLCALAQQLAERPAVRPWLRYRPNSSLYHTGAELRYIEQHYGHGQRGHQISALDASAYLLRLLAAAGPAGSTPPELVAALLDDEAERADVTDFVDALIDAQLLVSELEPTVTGPEFLDHLRAVLARVQAAAPAGTLEDVAAVLAAVQQQLTALDRRPANAAADYERVAAALAPLGVPIEPGKLFQTDATLGLTPGEPATLGTAVQDALLEALEVLSYLSPPPQQARLDDFTQRFQARYEDREVPLLEALDNESGLPYADYGTSRYSPLVHDLVLTGTDSKDRSLRQTEVQQFMYRKLREAERNRQYSVELSREELLAQGFRPAAKPLPPSLPVLFRLIDGERVLLESAGGSSAVNLLGRFAHADPGIGELVRAVTEQEQAHNPGVAFAEICHLPSHRVGNVLLRPHFRALEIPYLAQSTLPPAGQVPVQDLALAVRNGQLVLRARSTNQLIVPRLSTAHNFTQQALPVYQFLCDLQTQGLQTQLGFSWSMVSLYAKFTPRLSYRAVVLQPAAWQLEQADVQELLAAAPAAFAAAWAAFRQQWQLPRLFTLADGDNELLVDADNALLVRTWLDTVRARPSFQLKEFLFEPAASPVRDAAGRPYVPQCIALLVRQQPCYSATGLVPAGPATSVTREFSLGSEWLYYKLYCGQVVADRVLTEAVAPLTAELQQRGLIDTWFFIRYADPDHHLRVRWHLPDPGRIGEVVQLVSRYLQPFSASHAVWRIQTDTYRRELERYGPRTIEWAEQLFCYHSQAVLEQLGLGAEAPAEPWLWGLTAIDELLTAFELPLPRKLALFEQLKESFAREFSVDKAMKLQLDAKYRQARPAIRQALETAEALALPAPPALAAVAAAVNALHAQGQLEVPREQLLGSYVHMLLNRLIPADARLHELVLYDFLYRHYQSQHARQRV